MPWIRTDDLEGGLYVPEDGVTDPTNTALSLARGAKDRGTGFNLNFTSDTWLMQVHLIERFRKHADTDTDTDMVTVSVHVSRVLDFVSQIIGMCHLCVFPDKHDL